MSAAILPPAPGVAAAPSPHIYWFRNDLRLDDNPGLIGACQQACHLLFVYCHGTTAGQSTAWKVPRSGSHRQQFLAASLADLAQQLQSHGSQLLELQGDPVQLLPALAAATGATTIHCEDMTSTAIRVTGCISPAGAPIRAMDGDSISGSRYMTMIVTAHIGASGTCRTINVQQGGQAGVVDRAAIKEAVLFVTVRHQTYTAIGFVTLV